MSNVTISYKTFFSDVLNITDSVVNGYTQTVYGNFVNYYQMTITVLLTVYIVGIGYRVLMRTETADVFVIVRHLITLLCVFSLVMMWKYFNIFVYNVFTNEPSNIAQILIKSSGHYSVGGSVNQALDTFFSSIETASDNYFSHVGWSKSGAAFLIYAILVLIGGVVLMTAALFEFIGAKMAMAIFLALGPIFIVMTLWDTTRNLFNSWISMLLTFAFIPILVSGILSLYLSIINIILPSVEEPPEQQNFAVILMFLVLSIAAAWFLKHVYSMSSSLAGGVTLRQFSSHLLDRVRMAGTTINTRMRRIYQGARRAGRSSGKGF